MNRKRKFLITGAAGFIGMHLAKKLLDEGSHVLGIDNLNDYYDVNLKKARLDILKSYNNFTFEKIDISDFAELNIIFLNFKPDKIINLAAQAGVSYSLENPTEYISSNISGFMNILECCRKHNVKNLIYASSSSVYGKNLKSPFSTKDRVEKPISIYAVTKLTNELMAHTYNHLFGIKTTGLRFFTVYGPWGRPDMAMYIFTKNILEGKKINIFNKGDHHRDFTYIDDVIQGIIGAINTNTGYEVFNIGNNKGENLMKVIEIIESTLDRKSVKTFLEIQPGDVEKTLADISSSINKLGYNPKITIEEGIPLFINWYKRYHDI